MEKNHEAKSPIRIENITKEFLFASDFDQTLSFNDSGAVLSEILGIVGFEERAAGLAKLHLVQQGGELAYLLRHDPEFRPVRKEHLIATGKALRLKKNIKLLARILDHGIEGYHFNFFVISAAPQEVVQSALEGIVPEENIVGTRLDWDPNTGEIRSIASVAAGYGKVAVLDELTRQLQVSPHRIVYVGDGSSDIHVMLHVNRRAGLTIAVSEHESLTSIAKRSVLSEDSMSVLVPVLEEVVGWNDPTKIRSFFERHGLQIQEWDKVQTDMLTLRAANG